MIDKRNALMKLAYGTQPKVNWPVKKEPVRIGSGWTERVRPVPKDQIPSLRMQADASNPAINTEARRAAQAASYGIRPKPPARAATPPATQAATYMQYPSWMQY